MSDIPFHQGDGRDPKGGAKLLGRAGSKSSTEPERPWPRRTDPICAGAWTWLLRVALRIVADSLSWGRRFRIRCIVDDCTREALTLVVDTTMVVDTTIGGRRMAGELDRLIARRGRPAMIVSDNGAEPKVGAAR